WVRGYSICPPFFPLFSRALVMAESRTLCCLCEDKSSNRQLCIPFKHPLLQLRRCAWAPQARPMRYTITQRTAVEGRSARDRADDADKFGLDRIRTGTDHCVAVAGHVDEFQV